MQSITGGIDKIRELVRVRDNHTCQLCFKKWDGVSRRLDVHHLDPAMESVKSYAYDRNNTDKMVTLCHKCHMSQRHNISFENIKEIESLVLRKSKAILKKRAAKRRAKKVQIKKPRIRGLIADAETARQLYELYIRLVPRKALVEKFNLAGTSSICHFLHKYGYDTNPDVWLPKTRELFNLKLPTAPPC